MFGMGCGWCGGRAAVSGVGRASGEVCRKVGSGGCVGGCGVSVGGRDCVGAGGDGGGVSEAMEAWVWGGRVEWAVDDKQYHQLERLLHRLTKCFRQ